MIMILSGAAIGWRWMGGDRHMRRGLVVAALLMILAVQAVSYSLVLGDSFSFNSFNHDDEEMYIATGHSLAHGRGYTVSFDPRFRPPVLRWPPGTSLIYAAGFRLGDTLLWPRLLNILLALVNTVLLWLLARDHLPDGMALCCVSMIVFSPVYDRFATILMSEQLLTTCSLASVLALGRWLRAGYGLDARALVGGLALAYGVLVRGHMLAVVPALPLVALFHHSSPVRRWSRLARASVLVAVALLPWTAWQVRGVKLNDPTRYESTSRLHEMMHGDFGQDAYLSTDRLDMVPREIVRDLPYRVLDSFAGLGWILQERWQVSLPKWLRVSLVVGLGGCLLAGLSSGASGAFVTLVVIFSLVILNGTGPARYYVSVVPLMSIVILCASRRLLLRLSPETERGHRPVLRAAGVVLSAAALVGLIADHRARAHESASGDVWSALIEIWDQAGELVPHDGVILSQNLPACQFVSGRHRRTVGDGAAVTEDLERGVYAVVTLPAATAEHGRSFAQEYMVADAEYHGQPVESRELTRNSHYTLVRLVPR